MDASITQPLHRSHEGVILFSQNNITQQLTIQAVNSRAQEYCGYSEEFLKGADFLQLFDTNTRNAIQENLEFHDDAEGLEFVMRRIPQPILLHKDGTAHTLHIQLIRIDARDQQQWFRLLLSSPVDEQQRRAFKHALEENFKGYETIEPESGLPDAQSFLKDIEMMHYYANNKELSSCVALVRLDKPAIHTPHGLAALKHLAGILRRNLRVEDRISRLDSDILGLGLVDATTESTRVVLNRLRWMAACEPLKCDSTDVPLVISVAFANARHAPQPIIRAMDIALQREVLHNSLVYVPDIAS